MVLCRYDTSPVWAEGKGQLELTIVITDLNYMFNTRKGYIKLPPYTQLRFTYAVHDVSVLLLAGVVLGKLDNYACVY